MFRCMYLCEGWLRSLACLLRLCHVAAQVLCFQGRSSSSTKTSRDNSTTLTRAAAQRKKLRSVAHAARAAEHMREDTRNSKAAAPDTAVTSHSADHVTQAANERTEHTTVVIPDRGADEPAAGSHTTKVITRSSGGGHTTTIIPNRAAEQMAVEHTTKVIPDRAAPQKAAAAAADHTTKIIERAEEPTVQARRTKKGTMYLVDVSGVSDLSSDDEEIKVSCFYAARSCVFVNFNVSLCSHRFCRQTMHACLAVGYHIGYFKSHREYVNTSPFHQPL